MVDIDGLRDSHTLNILDGEKRYNELMALGNLFRTEVENIFSRVANQDSFVGDGALNAGYFSREIGIEHASVFLNALLHSTGFINNAQVDMLVSTADGSMVENSTEKIITVLVKVGGDNPDDPRLQRGYIVTLGFSGGRIPGEVREKNEINEKMESLVNSTNPKDSAMDLTMARVDLFQVPKKVDNKKA